MAGDSADPFADHSADHLSDGFADDFAAALAAAVGSLASADLVLSPDDIDTILGLAREVAHGTEERRYAPLATYLAGRFVSARTREGASETDALAEAVAMARRALPDRGESSPGRHAQRPERGT